MNKQQNKNKINLRLVLSIGFAYLAHCRAADIGNDGDDTRKVLDDNTRLLDSGTDGDMGCDSLDYHRDGEGRG